ncbi:MAG: phosphatidate cytidylyltransferase [Rhodanobacteraceae bacterium]
MLIQRILTALVLAPLVVAAVLWLPAPAMTILAALIFMLGFDEWVMLCGFRGKTTRVMIALAMAAIFAALYLWHPPWLDPLLLCIGTLWWLLVLLWLRNMSFAAAPTRQNGLLKLVAGLLTIIPAWAALLWLHAHSQYGIWLLIALLMVWGADIGAYFAGTLFGRRKLAPHISPGKTWAGVYGALFVSLLVALVAGWLLHLAWPTLIGLLVLTVIAVAASIIGDLLESLAKRHALVKDSGALFPGHGGLMDRMDSVCALLPVFALGVWLLGL